jgi:hypothetical protein
VQESRYAKEDNEYDVCFDRGFVSIVRPCGGFPVGVAYHGGVTGGPTAGDGDRIEEDGG